MTLAAAPSKTVEYTDPESGEAVVIVVKRADYGQGLLRTMLMESSGVWDVDQQEASPETRADQVLRTILYPCMVAAVSDPSGMMGLFSKWPPPYEEFKAIPESLGILWEQATFTVNPSWRGQKAPENENGAEAAEALKAEELAKKPAGS